MNVTQPIATAWKTRVNATKPPSAQLGKKPAKVIQPKEPQALRRKEIVNTAQPFKQLKLLQREKLAYGGSLLKTRAGRRHGRPLSTKETMHLTLRSSKARGSWSFLKGQNPAKIKAIVKKFADRYHVQVISLANVGNHLHMQIKLGHRQGYKPFIRAITASIAMAVTGMCRWRDRGSLMEHHELETKQISNYKFWDYRPFTRVVQGFRSVLTLKDYIRINQLEGAGRSREHAVMIVKNGWFDSRDRRSA